MIRQQIDAYSRSFIDAWLTNRFNYFKTLSVRTNNWETIKNLFFVDIAYILGNQEMTNYARNAFLQHHNINYRADGASLDFWDEMLLLIMLMT
ncbi:alginate lyase family protein [Niabella hibiscisoli]|uniref:alginate lyase family protein n=1 Tax=Niabella hibiscisoli TaxID=1825928 RepID=UPI00374CC0E8